jgi:hypothetical protein
MANTTNYNWETPDDTDLVKDGAAAIRTLGSSIDTTTKNLNPETTTGDISYRSATANVNTRLALGTAGQVLKVNSGATAPEWATDASGMTNPMTTTGDTIYSSSGSTPARLAIGSTGNVLTVAGGVPTWAAPAGGGKVLQVVSASTTTQTTITSTTLTDSGITATITPTLASSKILVMISASNYGTRALHQFYMGARLLRGATQILDWGADLYFGIGAEVLSGSMFVQNQVQNSIVYLDSPATTSATTYKLQGKCAGTANSQTLYFQYASSPSNIILMEIGA